MTPSKSTSLRLIVAAAVLFCLFVGGYYVGRDLAFRDNAADAPAAAPAPAH